MAIAFTYTEATNTIVVTGGTSGTPAVFADFVTADRAGTATLLVATAGLSPTLALTYQIRPVEDMALLITFTIAAKSVHTDYIFITGTDWRGAAQTESIDVSAGNGAYVSTKYFRTITNIDCSDNSAGGGTQWADGTVAVTQPQWGVIWNNGNNQYRVDSKFTVGNGSTSTFFTAEYVQLSLGNTLLWTASATLRFGIYNSGMCYGGCNVLFDYWSSGWDISAGSIEVYNTNLAMQSSKSVSLQATGTCKFQDVTMDGSLKFSVFILWIDSANSGGFFIDCSGVQLGSSYDDIRGDTVSGITIKDSDTGFRLSGLPGGTYTFSSITVVGCTNDLKIEWMYSGAITANLLNCLLDFTSILWGAGLFATVVTINEQYLCDIHVADKDGANLASVTVLCEDKDGNDIFSVATEADGTITQQTITYRKYWHETTPQATVTYSPHKFTLSKAGYETLVLENITVDSPIDWHLELQPPGGAGARNQHIGIGVQI